MNIKMNKAKIKIIAQYKPTPKFYEECPAR